jgi:arylsulfatase A-like enzyme
MDGKTRTLKAIRDGQLEVSRADEERLRGLYAASVAYNDSELDEFLDAVLQHHAPEDVLLIVTSDHGEELFDHDGVLHGYTLYDEMLHIPLVMWWPGTIEPRLISHLTDTLDLHKTLGLAASSEARMRTSGGRSLWPMLLAGSGRETEHDKRVLFAAASSLEGGVFMARSEDFKVIWAPRTPRQWGQGARRGRSRDAEYAFDLSRDPTESVNLAGESRPEIDSLRSQLLAWVEAGKMLESGAPVDELDDATRESLRALGYLD